MKNKDFVILGVDVQEKKKTVKKYIDKTGIPFPTLLDSRGKVFQLYGFRGTPAHLLIGREGIIKAFVPGYKDMSKKSVYRLIHHLLDKP